MAFHDDAVGNTLVYRTQVMTGDSALRVIETRSPRRRLAGDAQQLLQLGGELGVRIAAYIGAALNATEIPEWDQNGGDRELRPAVHLYLHGACREDKNPCG